MQTATGFGTILPLAEIDSEADYVLFSVDEGLLSEHCTIGEARMAYFKTARTFELGEQLPTIYERQEHSWVPYAV